MLWWNQSHNTYSFSSLLKNRLIRIPNPPNVNQQQAQEHPQANKRAHQYSQQCGCSDKINFIIHSQQVHNTLRSYSRKNQNQPVANSTQLARPNFQLSNVTGNHDLLSPYLTDPASSSLI